LRGNAGLAEFTEDCVHDDSIVNLARKVNYKIDPQDEYPRNYTGNICATLRDGSVIEECQPYLRGGIHAPLSRNELLEKCEANLNYVGVDPSLVKIIEKISDDLQDMNKAFSLSPLT